MSPVWAIWTRDEVDALLDEDLDLPRAGVRRRARVGHDRRPGPQARARGRAVDLLDVLGDARLVGGALDEGGLDLGALDPFSMSCDEELGDRVRVAVDEELGQVVVGVDAGARHDLQAGLLGDSAHEGDVAAEEHRGRVADRLHSVLHHSAGAVDGHVELLPWRHRVRRFLLDGACVRPLGEDRLVADQQVLVDQRAAELGGVDRAGDGLDHGHGRASLWPRAPTKGWKRITIAVMRRACSPR